MRRLVPCPGCQRHLFPDESACPHCGKPLGDGWSRMGTLGAFAVTAGLTLSACVEVYGPPPVDKERRVPEPTTTSTAAAEQPTTPVPVYGPPPQNPDIRVEPTAAPSTTATAAPSVTSPPPTSTTTETRPPAKVYGPPPRNPKQRDPLNDR